MTSRGTGVWGSADRFSLNYVNGRKQNSDEIYDASGNIIEDPTTNPNIYDRWKFDAAGRTVETVSRWYQGAPQQTSFDKTDTISQTFDGDGRSVKYSKTRVSTQIYPPNTTTGTSTEYFVRSTVLGGKILTELNAQGEKKLTNIYAGAGVLAEQRTFPPSGQNAQPWSEVFWKHEDLVTGGYQKIIRNGTAINTSDPPSKAEFEPLGGIVPESDPNLQEPDNSTFPESYRWGGNVERPENGCAWNGAPISCSLLSTVIRGADSVEIHVNTRAEGGWGLYQSLQTMVSLWRYNVRELVNDEDSRLTRANYADTANWQGDRYRLFLGSYYVAYLSQFAETLISQRASQYQSQQHEVPKTPRGANYSRDQIRALTGAYNDALNRLQNPDCAALFTDFYDRYVQFLNDLLPEATGQVETDLHRWQTTASRDPAQVLKNIEFRILPLAAPHRDENGIPHAVSAQTNSRNSVFISNRGTFFNRTILVEGRITDLSGYMGTRNLSQTQFGALLLLHELGHAYGEIGGSYLFFGPDSQDANRNREHTQRIIDACFPELN